MSETKLEHILTHSYKADMVAHMKSHPEDFEEAIKLAISDQQPYSWKAAWLLWSCMEKNDQRIHRYVEKIIDTIPSKCDEQVRELLIILQRMELAGYSEGKLFDTCINIWEKIGKQASIRYNAFKLMMKIIKDHPDLSKEIAFLTESCYTDSLSDNVKKSISKMTAALK
ncbi:hypothetical protein L3073_17985 [Ancylomarina sp. DW003]|nr:hypothetical protein [Ancylomarina sp. DW003]MDE5424108.1 hypothetical protein [Ancylomarina sp. DW003]